MKILRPSQKALKQLVCQMLLPKTYPQTKSISDLEVYLQWCNRTKDPKLHSWSNKPFKMANLASRFATTLMKLHDY